MGPPKIFDFKRLHRRNNLRYSSKELRRTRVATKFPSEAGTCVWSLKEIFVTVKRNLTEGQMSPLGQQKFLVH